MGVTNDPPRDVLDALINKTNSLQRQLDELRAQLMNPTVPIFDSSDFPQNAVEGQVAIAPVL